MRCTATGSFYPWLSDHRPSSGWATASLTLTMQIIPQNAPQSHRDHHHGGREDYPMIHFDDFRGDKIICSLASFPRHIWNLFRSDQIIFGTKALQDLCSSFRGDSAVVYRQKCKKQLIEHRCKVAPQKLQSNLLLLNTHETDLLA